MYMKGLPRKSTILRLFGGMVFALLLAACDALPGGEESTGEEGEQAQQPIVETSPIVSATGEVVPARWTELSFTGGGQVDVINVEEGDVVSEGDLLVELDLEDLEAAVELAEAGLAQQQANLERAKAGPRQEELDAAQRAVDAANARTAAAAARRDALYNEVTEADIAAAEQELMEARSTMDDINLQMGAIITWAGQTDLESLDPSDRNPIQAGEGLAYQAELAMLNLAAAEAQLADLLDGPNPDAVRLENARIGVAYAQAEAARARLALLEAQPFAEDIALAEAQVVQAEADVAAARAQLDLARILAPFDGTIVNIYVDIAEFIGPSQRVVQIADLSSLQVETTDLNEIDVARVQVGDAVNVTFDALPGVDIDGTVMSIAPKAEEGTGVNYTVVIEMDDIPDGIRWGMTAFVDIEVSE